MSRPILFISLFMIGGCASHEAPNGSAQNAISLARFEVVNPDTGYSATFDGKSVRVVTGNFADKPLTWSRPLSPAERAFLTERIGRVPLDTLKERYDSGVWDGFRLGFAIRPAGGAERSISIANEFVPALADLTEAMDALLPPDNRIGYRAWKEEADRLAADVDE